MATRYETISSDEESTEHENVVRFLIMTDNHLGYLEKDVVRGNDSFEAFEEILQNARKYKVDGIIHSGDLFDISRPTRNTLYRTMTLLRKYCMSDDPIYLQIVSDQSMNFPNYGLVNYEDPNYNIGIPFFGIHGNHDDPVYDGTNKTALSAMELLSTCNLVNYFGKQDTLENIVITPILIKKGTTFIALYGIGYIRDERLYRMFLNGKVTFQVPKEDTDKWFNILLIHQNRPNKGRGNTKCIPDSFIPDLFHLIIWGHEHESIMELQENLHLSSTTTAKHKSYILQPGSSIITSLIEVEAKPKHFGILEIIGTKFRLQKEQLRTVRPLLMDSIYLSVEQVPLYDKVKTKYLKDIESQVRDKIDQMLKKYKENEENEISRNAISRPDEKKHKLPIVRLYVESDEQVNFNIYSMGMEYENKVANPSTMFLLRRKRKENTSDEKKNYSGDRQFPIEAVSAGLYHLKIVENEINKNLTTPLHMLPEFDLHRALEEYICKDKTMRFADIVEENIAQVKKILLSKKEIIDDVPKTIRQIKKEKCLKHSINDEPQAIGVTVLESTGNGHGERNVLLTETTEKNDMDSLLKTAANAVGFTESNTLVANNMSIRTNDMSDRPSSEEENIYHPLKKRKESPSPQRSLQLSKGDETRISIATTTKPRRKIEAKPKRRQPSGAKSRKNMSLLDFLQPSQSREHIDNSDTISDSNSNEDEIDEINLKNMATYVKPRVHQRRFSLKNINADHREVPPKNTLLNVRENEAAPSSSGTPSEALLLMNRWKKRGGNDKT